MIAILPILADWPVTLPTGGTNHPDNDYLPDFTDEQLRDTVIPGRDEHGPHVRFRVHPASVVTTKNSEYGRSEARQAEVGQRWKLSGWPSSGPRTLAARLAIDCSRLVTRPRCNGLQIHDGSDDVMQIMRHETDGLGVMYRDGKAWLPLDPGYVDGTPFDCIITVLNSRVTVTYNGSRIVGFDQAGSGWYWKAGCYVQTGGKSEHREPTSAVAEVAIYRLEAT